MYCRLHTLVFGTLVHWCLPMCVQRIQFISGKVFRNRLGCSFQVKAEKNNGCSPTDCFDFILDSVLLIQIDFLFSLKKHWAVIYPWAWQRQDRENSDTDYSFQVFTAYFVPERARQRYQCKVFCSYLIALPIGKFFIVPAPQPLQVWNSKPKLHKHRLMWKLNKITYLTQGLARTICSVAYFLSFKRLSWCREGRGRRRLYSWIHIPPITLCSVCHPSHWHYIPNLQEEKMNK